MIQALLPQCQDFSWQKEKLCGGGSVSIAYIMQSFHKFILSLLSSPTPYEGSTMQITCGSPGLNNITV